jgi:ABC-2 type transport system ATP-binding protein
MLQIKNISKKYEKTLALDQVSLEVRPGEIYALIGPNGSGKTTLIKIIAGLVKATGGGAAVGGQDIETKAEAAKALIGYMPDEPAIWSAMTGEEFLKLTGALYKMKSAERDAAIPGLLALFQLDQIKNEYFEEYSRGNKQKFSLLAALLHQPKLLLIDEPIVGLDPVSAQIAKDRFVAFARARGSVLLVTHTLSVAESIADRIGFLKNGKLIKEGRLAELKTAAGLSDDASLEDVYKKLV